jgi:hypothetical protein
MPVGGGCVDAAKENRLRSLGFTLVELIVMVVPGCWHGRD